MISWKNNKKKYISGYPSHNFLYDVVVFFFSPKILKFFFISPQKHVLWVLIRSTSLHKNMLWVFIRSAESLHKNVCCGFSLEVPCMGTHYVCVEVLRPSQPNGVMSSAVSLPNHTFTGQA